jgi:hypothetical protein
MIEDKETSEIKCDAGADTKSYSDTEASPKSATSPDAGALNNIVIRDPSPVIRSRGQRAGQTES